MHEASRDCIDEIMNSIEIQCEEEVVKAKKRIAAPPREPSEPPPQRLRSPQSRGSSSLQTGKLAVIQPAAKVVKMDEDSVVVSRIWLKSILDCVDRAEVCLSEKLWSCPFKSAPRLRN